MSLAGRDLGVVIGPSGTATHSHLGECDDVQSKVELAVAATGQAMTNSFGAGNFDRGDAGVVSQRRRRRESAAVSGACQQPAGDDRPDIGDLAHAAAGRGDGVGELSGEGLQPLVCITNLRDKVTGKLLANSLHWACRVDAGQQPRRDCPGQVGRGATGQKLWEQSMD